MTTQPRHAPGTDRAAKPQNIWLLGMRPRTLTMAAVPVMVGAVLAWAGGADRDWVTFFATLMCAVLIQIGTNLFNETYLVSGNSAFDTTAAYVEQVYGRPREFLVSLTYEF